MKLALVALVALAALTQHVARAAEEAVVYSPFAAALDSFPVGGAEGIEIRRAGPAELPSLATAGLTMNYITVAPCHAFAPHYQPDAEEALYMVEGKLNFAIVDLQGKVHTQELGPGDMAVMPLGTVHALSNENCEPVVFVNVFTNGNTTRVPMAPTMAAFGSDAVADAFGLAAGTEIKAAPLLTPIATGGCPAKCKK